MAAFIETFFMGAALAPYLKMLELAGLQGVIITAALGSVSIFASFTLAVLLNPSRSFLYLGGPLMSAMMWLFVVQFVNMFFRFQILHTVELYGGLAMFMAYVVFDTQLTIHDADTGKRDYVMNAMDLFLDLINIFVRLLAILSKDEKKKK